MRILYLLEGTGLGGGTIQVFNQADTLAAMGHEVTVAHRGPGPGWHEPDGWDLVRVEDLARDPLPPADAVIGTFFPTLGPALSRGGDRALHLCQGYEGGFEYLRPRLGEIEAAYRLGLPVLSAHPPIAGLVEERYGSTCHHIGIGLEEHWFEPRPELPGKHASAPARVLVVGPHPEPAKGVDRALEALRIARKRVEVQVVRISPIEMREAEREQGQSDEFHTPSCRRRTAELTRGADLALDLSGPLEGFGMPLLEALACAVPSIASDTPAHRAFTSHDDWTVWVDRDEPGQIADAIVATLTQRPRQRIERGLEVASGYRFDAVGARMIEGIDALLGAPG